MITNIRGCKSWIKSVVGQTFFYSRLHQLLLKDNAVVVAFHRVNNITAGDGLTSSVAMFERYCQFFADYFHVVHLRDIVEKIENGEPINRQLAITFDDGYQDNYEYAGPLLKAFGLPATFFLATQFIDTQFVPWWDRNHSIRQKWMTWDHIRWLCREGFEIGSHTRTHADLGEVLGDRAREEVCDSRRELEENLHVRVDLFAYPYGGPSQISKGNREMVKAAGFRCCCSCYGGMNSTETDPFHLQRIPIASGQNSVYELGCDIALRRT